MDRNQYSVRKKIAPGARIRYPAESSWLHHTAIPDVTLISPFKTNAITFPPPIPTLLRICQQSVPWEENQIVKVYHVRVESRLDGVFQ